MGRSIRQPSASSFPNLKRRTCSSRPQSRTPTGTSHTRTPAPGRSTSTCVRLRKSFKGGGGLKRDLREAISESTNRQGAHGIVNEGDQHASERNRTLLPRSHRDRNL